MRIIHGHDFYDNALAYGQDDQVVFVREKEHFVKDEDIPYLSPLSDPVRRFWFLDERSRYVMPSPVTGRFEHKKKKFFLRHLVVLLCGKVYTGLLLTTEDAQPPYERAEIPFWTAESFQGWLDMMNLRPAKRQWYGYRWMVKDKDRVIDPVTFFQTYDAPKELVDWMVTNKVVVAIRHPDLALWRNEPLTWEINSDRLKHFQFYKRLDAYTVFQEISMWVGGVLPSAGKEMVKIADTVRIEKHGFDKRTSFRNMDRE